LVQRLLLLEAVQQPVAWSFLAQALHGVWQQQQHLDLARAANGSSSNSSSSRSSSPQEVWVPQLLQALLQHAVGCKILDTSDVLRTLEEVAALSTTSSKQQQQQQQGLRSADRLHAPAGSADDKDSSRATEGAAAASYMLGCLSDSACRVSLACWVLTWHGCMQESGADYGSAASR
jgi:hypothetical protein